MPDQSDTIFWERCCTCTGDCIEAQTSGASRIELCERLDVGGVTPSPALVKETLSVCSLPINVLIRPREGDFVYSEDEITAMERDIQTFKSMGVNAVVIGALQPDGSIDIRTMKRLIAAARPLPVTFHRAFDRCSEPLAAFEQIIELGCERLLTSGHAADALQGAPLIAELVRRSRGRIVVMAGKGVRPDNLELLLSLTAAPEYHSSAVLL